MKRPLSIPEHDDPETKRAKLEEGRRSSLNLDENLIYEVLKHADARTVATASCVSRLWRNTGRDERLWEALCTSHWPSIGCNTHQLRSVVLALGGFRRLHSLYLWPLSKTQNGGSKSKNWSLFPKEVIGRERWGRDEVNLSLSLLSIRFYEKMSSGRRN